MPRIAHDTYHFARRRFAFAAIDHDLLADRIPIREMFASECLINYDHQRRIFCVGAGKGAPLEKGNFHRLKIIGFDDEVTSAGMIAARQWRRATDHERIVRDVSAQR